MSVNEIGDKLLADLKKHNLKVGYDISFPQYRILPNDVKLALSILKEHKMRITMSLESINNK